MEMKDLKEVNLAWIVAIINSIYALYTKKLEPFGVIISLGH